MKNSGGARSGGERIAMVRRTTGKKRRDDKWAATKRKEMQIMDALKQPRMMEEDGDRGRSILAALHTGQP